MRTRARTVYAQSQLGRWLRGKWRLERVLGVGGTSAVFAARHRNGARVAIKLLHPELAEDARLRARFLREAPMANLVCHPAVVRVLDDDDSDDQPFLVLELVEGRTLAELTDVLPLEQRELLEIADQLLGALSVAHAVGIVHRDIKPQNLVLDERHRLRVLDFGLARLIEEDAMRSLLTSVNDVWGTLEYMAPEQLTGIDEITVRADVYAVGATLFRLASGQYVYEAAHSRERVLKTLNTPARSLATATDRFDPAVVRLVDRATLPRASERWQSAQEMLDEVQRLHAPARNSGRRMRAASEPPIDAPTRRDRPPLRLEEDSDGVTTPSGEFPGLLGPGGVFSGQRVQGSA